jgi:hypothetical protein
MRMLLLIVLLSLLIPFSISADMYKYVDKNGIAHFTDDMSKVPEAYQNQVVRHAVPKYNENIQEDAVKDPNAQIPKVVKETLKKENSEGEKKKSQPDAIANKNQKALLKEKVELDEEYAALMKEKGEISESIREWSKRYKTRRRKGVARKKLKELEVMEMEWEEKYKAWENKKSALDKKMR